MDTLHNYLTLKNNLGEKYNHNIRMTCSTKYELLTSIGNKTLHEIFFVQ